MEQSTKDLWIQKLKQGRVLVIQSALAPLKKDCLWFKNGALYVYGNRGWEDLGVGDGGDEPAPIDPKYVPTPIVFDEFEVIQIDIEGVMRDAALLSEQINIPNTAQEFQEESYITFSINGVDTSTLQFDPGYFITEDNQEMFEQGQQILELAIGENAELVSMQSLGEGKVIMIADVNEERKIFIIMMGVSTIPEGTQITINSPEPQPEPEPEPEPSDRVYVPVPTELEPFISITYDVDDPSPIKGETKGEMKSSYTKTLPVSSTIVPDNAAGFEVTENLCIPIRGTYEVIDRSINPFSMYPYWLDGCDSNDITEVSFYYDIVGIMNSFYDPSDYELLHYDRFWDSDRHFQVDTWTAKVMERGSRAKIERTRLFVTMELDPETTTIEDTSVMFYINDAILA